MELPPPRTPEEMNAALDALTQTHYYSEEHESVFAARDFLGSLAPADRGAFEEVFLARLAADRSVANLFFAGAFGFQSAVPEVVAALDGREDANSLTRTILWVLSQLGDGGYGAMERFLDSELEIEALTWLAGMDFDRSIPHIRRALHRDHMLKPCLHVLAAYRRSAGLPGLLEKVSEIYAGDPGVGHRLKLAVGLQDDPYNPIEKEERDDVLAILL